MLTSSYDSAARVLADAGDFLTSQPVMNNLVLTLLHARVARPEPGRYWVARDGNIVAGVVFQSPLDLPAILTSMTPAVVMPVADSMALSGVSLPGVSGQVETVSRFAGRWTEWRKSGAVPVKGERIYEFLEPGEHTTAPGVLRQAGAADRTLLVDWVQRFQIETGGRAKDPERAVEERLPAGQFWIWQDGEPVAIAACSAPLAGVVRVQYVYTSPEQRAHGYGGACVRALSLRQRDNGYRCMLFANLGNPVPNSIYRRIGYRAIGEGLTYRFT
jgi:GNAT superfamily N-acetyltransferase